MCLYFFVGCRVRLVPGRGGSKRTLRCFWPVLPVGVEMSGLRSASVASANGIHRSRTSRARPAVPSGFSYLGVMKRAVLMPVAALHGVLAS
ncbi:MAG: hypothetical protein ACI8TP_003367 [Acidimicrobiales bacterium]|jgi:hypothetical protein